MGPEIATAYVRVKPNVSGFENEVSRHIGTAGKKSGSKFGSLFRASTLKILGAVGGLFAGFEFFKGGISRLIGLEEANSRLKAMGLSTKQVDGLTKSLLETLKGTAYSLDEGAGVMAQLVTTGLGLKDVKEVMQLTADTAAFAKVPLGEIGGIFQEIASTGKLTGDTLFSLQARGIPALDLLADAAGVSGEEMKKMVSEGKIDAETFFDLWEKGSQGFGENNIKIAGAAKNMGDTTAGAFANMRTAAARLAADLAGPFFEKAKGAFTGATDYIDRFGEVAVPVVESFATFLFDTAIPAISDFGSTAGEYLSQAFEVVGPIVKSAYDAVVGFIEGLRSNSGEISAWKDTFLNIWNAIKDATSAAWTIIYSVVQAAIVLITQTWERSGAHWLAAVKQIWDGIFQFLQGAVQIISGILNVLAGVLTLDWERAWNGLKDIVGGVWNVILGIINTGMGAIRGAITVVMGVIQTIWSGIWTAIVDAATAVWDSITGSTQSGLETTSGFFQSIFGAVAEWWSGVWTSIVNTVSSVWDSIYNFVVTGLTAVADFITNSTIWQLWISLWQATITVVQTVWNTIVSVVQASISVLSGIFNAGMQLVTTVWQTSWNIIVAVAQAVWQTIQGVVQVAINLISNIIQATLATIQQIWNAVWNAVLTIAQSIWQAIQAVIQTTFNFIYNNIISPILNLIQTIWQTVWNAISAFTSAIWNTMSSTVNTIFTAIWTFIQNTLNTLRSYWDTIWQAVSTFLTNTWNTMNDTVNRIFNDVWNFIQDTLNTIQSTWEDIWNAIKDFFSDAWNTMLTTIERVGGDIVEFVQGIPGSITDAFSGLADRMYTIGSNILGALGRGISSAVSGVAETIKNAIGSFVGAVTGGDGLGQLAGALQARLFPTTGSASTSGLGTNIAAAFARIRGAFPLASITSGYRPGATTLSGSTSYHALGRAIDLVPASMALFNVVRALFPNATELIYTPAGARQLWHGASHIYSGGVAAQHYDHIHLALQRGGRVPGNAPYADRIPALLSPGEWVINRDVVEQLGERTLSLINSGRLAGVLSGLEHGTKKIPGLATGAYFANRTRLNGPIDIAERTPEFVTPEPQLKRVIAEVMGASGMGQTPIVNVYIGNKRINELARIEVQRDMLRNRIHARAGG